MVIKNKKGFFFTLIIMTILSMLILSSAFYIQAQYRESVQKRVSSMNSYLNSVETDLERQLYVSGYRTVFLLEKNIVDSGAYIANPEALVAESFINGSLNLKAEQLLQDATFSKFLTSTVASARELNININITNPMVNLTQEDPWNLLIVFKANLTMGDSSGVASWNKTMIIKSLIPISDFEDPVYLLNTGGRLPITPIKTTYTFSAEPANLLLHLQNSYYIESTEAPSFIDRIKGNLASQSLYGVESLVDLNKINALGGEGLPIYPNKPLIDHIYFDLTSTASSCRVQSTAQTSVPTWVLLDNNHLAKYGTPVCN